MKLGVLISGRGSNLLAILQAKSEGKLPHADIAVVFSNKPEAKGLDHAHEFGIPAESIPSKEYKGRRSEYDQKLIKMLMDYGCEAIILAGYMRIISKEFLDAFPNAVINIHPSLLPSFPGLDAQKQAFDYGVKITGCTVHFVDEGVDSGPVIFQETVPVLPEDTAESLSARILEKEHPLLIKGVKYLTENKLEIQGRRVLISEDTHE